MNKRNRVLCIPYCEKTKNNLESSYSFLNNFTTGWWFDSIYNTAESGDSVVVVDNSNKKILFSGFIVGASDMDTNGLVEKTVSKSFEGDHSKKKLLFIRETPNHTVEKPFLSDWVTKTGTVQGTTLRYGK